MKKLIAALAAVAALAVVSSASAAGWTTSVPFTNQVASSPVHGWGYPDVGNAPVAGNCGKGEFNSNRSESWIAVQPGTENLVGSSKFFFDKYSTFYNFYLGAYTIQNGSVTSNQGIPGYDCVTTGTQDMPPSWTNNTDPNVDFDSQGRAYEVTLPFNAYWSNLHPNGAIGADYSDDLGRTWKHSTGSDSFGYLEYLNNESSFSFGGFEDKQWVAANHYVNTGYTDSNDVFHSTTDHVYAMWSVFNGQTVKLRESVSRDRGLTFSKPITINVPSQTGPATTFVYPSVAPDGTLWVALASSAPPPSYPTASIYVTQSKDDGQTFAPWTFVANAQGVPGDENFPNGTFRDGILENFAASQRYPDHAYVTYEDWNPATTTMDVKFAYTTTGLNGWKDGGYVNDPSTVNDTTDQFQPSVAAGPNGAVAVAFYDRRGTCPNDKSVAPENQGAANTCIDTSLQAYKDNGKTVSKVGTNVRITNSAWDPSEPRQHVDGIGQIACYRHRDPCDGVFIGDYFGLAISSSNVYALFVSTHYPSSVKADEGGKVYYQQQLLATVPLSGFGF
jgi:hypothetical protein